MLGKGGESPPATGAQCFLGYSASMFEVLAFVYENYAAGPCGPQSEQLERSLLGVGFESDEIDDALAWLEGLDSVVDPQSLQPWLVQPSALSTRVYPRHERVHLGPQALGFLYFLESSQAMPAHMREVVVDRAMAAPGGPVTLDDLKLIILMVYQRFGVAPDVLVMDELCDAVGERVAH